MRYLLFDISNILYRTFFAHTGENDITIAGLATHTAFVTLNKYFKQFKPHKVVMVFDRTSWRKEYTKSEDCISKRLYKGNRRKNMSPAQQAKYARFLGHLSEFETLVTNHTTIITLAAQNLEADDLIAGFVQMHPEDENIIISSDRDMLQLLKHKNVKIYSPDKGKEQTLEEYDNDAKYFIFVKCIRGDHQTDNIQSAFPGVSIKRIQKAYKDPFERVKLMKERWRNENSDEFMVEDLYYENILLTDLEQQPPEIRELIKQTVEKAKTEDKKFSHFHLMRFLGKYDLQKISDGLDQYMPLLSR